MKLQIDATVLYAITKGKYNLKRKIIIKYLEFDDPFNTYLNKVYPQNPFPMWVKKQ